MLGVETRQVEAVAAPDRVEPVVLGVGRQPEARRQHEHVDLALAPVDRPDAAIGDPLDRL